MSIHLVSCESIYRDDGGCMWLNLQLTTINDVFHQKEPIKMKDNVSRFQSSVLIIFLHFQLSLMRDISYLFVTF